MKGYLCSRCGNTVKNPCIHDSQVKWCKQKPVNEVYGHYETLANGVVIEKGIGVVDVTRRDEEFAYAEDGDTITRVSICTLS